MYFLPLSGPTPCVVCDDFCSDMLWCEHCRIFTCSDCWSSDTSNYCAHDEEQHW